MQALLDHEYAVEFFNGPGYRAFSLTSPYARLRNECCIVCHEKLRSEEPNDQQVLLTHSGSCMETLHAVCLLESLKHNPLRCPYYPHDITHRGSDTKSIQRFGELVLEEPDRVSFHDQQELLTTLGQLNNTIDTLLTMCDVEEQTVANTEQTQSEDIQRQSVHERMYTRDFYTSMRHRNNLGIARWQKGTKPVEKWHSRRELFEWLRTAFDGVCRSTYEAIVGTWWLGAVSRSAQEMVDDDVTVIEGLYRN